MKCAFCGAEAVTDADPRMPLLRIPSCWDCRDLLAYWLGWTRAAKGKTRVRAFWLRRETLLEVVRTP